MARGNQRDKASGLGLSSTQTHRPTAREKAQKKAAEQNKGKKSDGDGKSFRSKMEADANIMRQKQEAAAAKKAAEAAAGKA
ncbi:hypothetical protein B0A53_02955 [Rhodotorula sp. CCFEE 5036]|nr:hypothetical protein B0A53_02955 [Rhodotorula sp. CCFEE 5036]